VNEGGNMLLIGLVSGMGCTILTGVTAYFTVIRTQLTKEDHAVMCDQTQKPLHVELKFIREALADQGKKLDRILINGRGGN